MPKIIARLIIYIAILVILFITFNTLEIKYSYVDVKDYIVALLSVSSMVFTLMGIWIAFIYPNALQRLVNPNKTINVDFSETLSETKRLESLVGSILKSSFVVMMIMLIFIAKIILSNILIDSIYLLYVKSSLLSFVIFLSVLQFESIFYVIYSNIMFVNDIHRKREDREADEDI